MSNEKKPDIEPQMGLERKEVALDDKKEPVHISNDGKLVLENKVAIVTGGSLGIGRATALKLAENTGQKSIVRYIQKQLQSYKAGKPYQNK